jgi:hypothetical protein
VAGKVTYLHGRHASVDAGGWVDEIKIAAEAWLAMESALDRPLTAAERERIADVASLHRHFLMSARVMRVPTQDQKKTLSAMARLPLPKMLAAFKDMDESTHALIVGELHRAGAPVAGLLRPDPESLRAAAVAAMVNMKATGGGHPSSAPRMLAGAVRQLWRDLGGADRTAAATRDYATPPVRFARALFAAAGVHRSASAVAKLLETAR